ncbi:MAG TPA: AAA family ATPase [Candidatus Dojkabacteria bacterium]|nr:AAA family ATPase [Candidatus Dojkabacteria bacterium]
MKIAFTGSHGTGKTTSMFNYAHTMKIENPNKRIEVFHENAARTPKELFNKNGTRTSQMWIFTNQIRTEIELCSLYDILICDRTCFDSIAYAMYMGFDDLAEDMFKLANHHIFTYDIIFFKQIKTNDYLKYCIHRDTEDLNYRQWIEDALIKLYEKAGIIISEKFKFV